MKKLLGILAIVSVVVLCGFGQFQIGQRSFNTVAVPPLSVLASANCFSLGVNSPNTTSAIDTTGASMIAVSIAYQIASGTLTVTDNKGNGDAVALPPTTTGTNVESQIFYWLNPTVGTGHTFTVTGGSPYFASACITPIAGGSGVFDSSALGANANPTCAIEPFDAGSGPHILITTAGATLAGTASIDNSFTVDAQQALVAATSYGIASAHLIQSPNGSSVSAVWTIAGSVSCTVASFH